MQSENLTIKEAAAYAGIGINKMRKLAHRDDFPVIRLGERTVRIPKHALDKWLNEQIPEKARA